MADDSALVLVGPEDTVDDVIRKLRRARAQQVQLLVAEGAQALQGLGGLSRVRQSADENNTALLLISSDEKTLNAARLCQIETLEVRGAQVVGPSARDVAGSDEELLRAIDDLPAAAPGAYGYGDDPDDEAYIEPLDAPTEPQGWRGVPVGDEAPEEWDERPPPRRRRQAGDEYGESDESTYVPQEGRSRRGNYELAGHSSDVTRRRSQSDDQERPASRPRNPLLAAIPVVLVLLLLGIGAVLFLGNRVTITVGLPQVSQEEQPFSGQVVPTTPDPPSDPNSPAVQVVPVRTTAVFTATGSVSGETQAPNNPARGTVTLRNYNAAAVDLPQGTEFVAINGQGQEVRFTSDAPVTVGPATTGRQGVQIVTSPGEAGVAITARSPGSGSNIGPNTITQMAIPGQQPVALRGVLEIEHGPVTGGDERAVRIVTDADVDQLLSVALTSLDEAGKQALQAQAAATGSGLQLENSTIAPTRDQLAARGTDQVYELTVAPDVGQEVDPANPSFTVTVRAPFSALATPPNRSLTTQLATALPRQLDQAGKLTTGLAPTITGWRWDGSSLLVDGVLKPDGTVPRLDAQTRAVILDSVRGKSYADARAALQGFVDENVIGSFTLPQRETMPSLNFQLELRVEQ